jgi:hypothetical protein
MTILAVIGGASSALAAQRSGKGWITEPIGQPVFDAQLSGTAAFSSSDIWAVGRQIDHWDGSTWTVVPGANVSGAFENPILAAVATIPGTDRLWAVGESSPAGSGESPGFIERYNGTAWNQVKAPPVDMLSAVVAASPTDAWAAGFQSSGKVPVALHWDGKSWQSVSVPLTGAEFTAVAELSSNDVLFAGELDSSQGEVPLVEQWNGSSFVQETVHLKSNSNGELRALGVIPGTSDVVAVGGQFSGSSELPLVVVRNSAGSWQPQTSATFPGNTVLTGVAAIRKTSVVAVGETNANPEASVAEVFNGLSWKSLPPDVRSTDDAYLSGITSVPNASEMVAVGSNVATTNGAHWARQDAPNVGVSVDLTSVHAFAANGTSHVWAAGAYLFRNADQPLVETFTGTGWSQVGFPTAPSGTDRYLDSIAATSDSDVWVSGWQQGRTGPVTALFANWDGSAWTIVPGPSNTFPVTQFNSDAIAGDGTVWVVGAAGDAGTLQSWNGSTWRTVDCGLKAGTNLTGVDVLSPSDVWASGQFSNSKKSGILIVHSDGSSCTVTKKAVGGPNEAGSGNLAGTADNNLWAVGSQFGSSSVQGVTVHVTGNGTKLRQRTSGFGLSYIARSTQNEFWIAGNKETAILQGSGEVKLFNGSKLTDVTPSIHSPYWAVGSISEALKRNDTWLVGVRLTPAGIFGAIAFHRE